MNDLAIGAAVGVAATAPMTLAMELMHRSLPRHERHPLPPREITERVAAWAGVRHRLGESERAGLALAAHFGYGAAAGAAYAPLARGLPLPPAVEGAAYGLAVWAGSYLGLLPTLGIMSPATRHPRRRNALMIAAHLVWGAALGVVVDQLEQARHTGGADDGRPRPA